MNLCSDQKDLFYLFTTTTPQSFYSPFSGTTRVSRWKLLDFMLQWKINRGRHTDNPAGHHTTPSGLISAHLHHSPIFYRPYALSAAQPTMSKHWRQLAHSD